jgi:guanylate kinase
MSLQKKYPDQTLVIFIKPPSIESLIKRLRQRATDTPEKIQERINKAEQELMFESFFDLVVVNEDLNQALKETEEAVRQFLK